MPAAHSSDPKFDHCDPRAFIAKSNIDEDDGKIIGVTLAYLDLSVPSNLDDPFPTINIGGEKARYTYNAMAYNPGDDYLYAVKQSIEGDDNQDLLRIGSDGVPKYVGSLAGLVDAYRSPLVVGEFGPGAIYYVVNAEKELYRYNLSTGLPVLVTNPPLNKTFLKLIIGGGYTIADFALYDGYLWSVATHPSLPLPRKYRVARIALSDLATAQEDLSLELGPELEMPLDKNGKFPEFTSVLAGADGIYTYDTPRGHLYKIDMSLGVLNQMTILKLAEGETPPGSDGAKCPGSPLGLPAEIVVTKVADQSTLVPGQPVTFTITITNDGPWGADGIEFSDPLPAGATGAQWTCTPSGGNAKCTPTSGSSGPINAIIDLPEKGESVTFQVTMQTDPNASNDLVNTATVTVPRDFKDEAHNNTATATVPLPGLEFSTSKGGSVYSAWRFYGRGGCDQLHRDGEERRWSALCECHRH